MAGERHHTIIVSTYREVATFRPPRLQWLPIKARSKSRLGLVLPFIMFSTSFFVLALELAGLARAGTTVWSGSFDYYATVQDFDECEFL